MIVPVIMKFHDGYFCEGIGQYTVISINLRPPDMVRGHLRQILIMNKILNQ